MAWVYFQDLIFSREIAVMSDYIEKYPEIRETLERIFTVSSGYPFREELNEFHESLERINGLVLTIIRDEIEKYPEIKDLLEEIYLISVRHLHYKDFRELYEALEEVNDLILTIIRDEYD